MPGDKKLTLTVTDEVHARLEEIGGELGINTTDVLRRAAGLLSIAHSLLGEVGDDLFICERVDGKFRQLHVISDMLY